MKPLFTKKHYKVIAGILAQHSNTHSSGPTPTWYDIRNTFLIVLRGDNPRFNAKLFLNACGVTQ